MEEKFTLLKPKIDVVFHCLFKPGNENIKKAMIEATTKEKIKSITLDNDRYLVKNYPDEKLGIVDLKATLGNGTICDIEIQLADNQDTAERFLFYWSKIYTNQLVEGDDYGKLNKVIGIIILDFKFEKTKGIEQLSTKWKIREVSTGKQIELTDVLEFYIIEIPKAREILKKDSTNQLAQWIMFLDNPNESEVSKIMKENKEIKEAMSKLEKISKDKELRRVAELREKAIRDEKNGLRHAREDGIKERNKGADSNNGLEQRKKTIRRSNYRDCKKIKTRKYVYRKNSRNNRFTKRKNRKNIIIHIIKVGIYKKVK